MNSSAIAEKDSHQRQAPRLRPSLGSARLALTGSATGTITYGYNAANQLTSATGSTTTWTYDGAGNQTKNGLTGTTTSYGVRGQATALGGTAQSYFGGGNTNRLTSGTTTFKNSGLGLARYSTGTTTHDYTRMPDGTPVSYRDGTNTFNYVTDHLGSVVGVIRNGAISGGYSYSPYGEPRYTGTGAGTVANKLRYIGGYQETATLYKLGARYYDTTLGRFTQTDPSGQERHPYAYAGCNPINNVDPAGTSLCSVAGTGAAIAGGIAGIAGFFAAFTSWTVIGGISLGTIALAAGLAGGILALEAVVACNLGI